MAVLRRIEISNKSSIYIMMIIVKIGTSIADFDDLWMMRSVFLVIAS